MDSSNTPSEQSSHSTNIPIIVIGGIILIILGGIGGYALGSARQNPSGSTSQVINPSPSVVTPTSTPFPTSEPTGIVKNYTNASLGISFSYETPFKVSENIQDATALKADNELWVSLPGSDQVILELYYYKSNLSLSDWWNSEGLQKIANYQNEFYAAIQPKPSPFPSPSFITKSGVLGGKETLVAEGQISAAQRSGIQTITLLPYKEGIYMFIQQEHDKSFSDKILSTLRFNE